MTTYSVPVDDRPRRMRWVERTDELGNPVVLRWWEATDVHHGGRLAPVVIDSKHEMAVFHGDEQVGTAPAPHLPELPGWPEFYPLVTVDAGRDLGPTATLMSHRIRPYAWLVMVAAVDSTLGLAIDQPLGVAERWVLASAFTALGYFPPLGLGWSGNSGEWEAGLEALEDRTARRVKRALVARLARERREMRALSTRIETHWK